MRNMGGLREKMKVSYLALSHRRARPGGHFPVGRLLVARTRSCWTPTEHYPTVYWMLIVAAFLTAFYMGRQIWMVFFGKPRTEVAAHAEESPKIMTVPLMVLASCPSWAVF